MPYEYGDPIDKMEPDTLSEYIHYLENEAPLESLEAFRTELESTEILDKTFYDAVMRGIKKRTSNQDWTMNLECGFCGRIYCDCDSKY